METIFSSNRNEFVSFSFNGGDETSIIARHKINASDRFYGAQLVETKFFSTQAGAKRWALKQLNSSIA